MPSPVTTAEFGSSIVTVGDINPAIFSADWLFRNQLIGEGDRDAVINSPTTVVSHQATVCETDWFRLQALPNQLVVASKGALSPALRDLAEGIFLLLPHMPVTAIGLNFHGHYQVSNQADWHKVGDALAPKSIWKELFPESDYYVGLANLQVKATRGAREDSMNPTADGISVQVMPSGLVRPGVFLTLNDHRGSFASDVGVRSAAEQAAVLVSTEWDQTWVFATRTFEALLSKAIAS